MSWLLGDLAQDFSQWIRYAEKVCIRCIRRGALHWSLYKFESETCFVLASSWLTTSLHHLKVGGYLFCCLNLNLVDCYKNNPRNSASFANEWMRILWHTPIKTFTLIAPPTHTYTISYSIHKICIFILKQKFRFRFVLFMEFDEICKFWTPVYIHIVEILIITWKHNKESLKIIQASFSTVIHCKWKTIKTIFLRAVQRKHFLVACFVISESISHIGIWTIVIYSQRRYALFVKCFCTQDQRCS